MQPVLGTTSLASLTNVGYYFFRCCLGKLRAERLTVSEAKLRKTLLYGHYITVIHANKQIAMQEQGESNKREERRWRWRVTRSRPWTRESKVRGLCVNPEPEKREINKNCWNLSKSIIPLLWTPVRSSPATTPRADSYLCPAAFGGEAAIAGEINQCS